MNERPDASDPDTASRRLVPPVDPAERTSPARDLRLTIVNYPDRSDRGTLHPPGLNGLDLMVTWLSADAGAFVDLDEWR